jgi:rfaE bifunctional protein nucleotidyltransferase chain/domain
VSATPPARPLVVVGDAFLDEDVDGRVARVCPDAPALVVDDAAVRSRPGGAALAAALAAATGRPVTLVAALSDDAPGEELRRLLAEAGVRVAAVARDGPTPVKRRVRADGRTVVRIDHGGRGPDAIGGPVGPALAALDGVDGRDGRDGGAAVLVSDYGRGVAALAPLAERLAAVASRVPIVWDPHPRGPSPVPGTRLATPNLAEAAGFAGADVGEHPSWAACARLAEELRRRWRLPTLALTLGDRGALVADGSGAPLVVPAAAATGDSCGAGDCFAATVAGALADGRLPSESVVDAVAAASRHVAGGGAGAWCARTAGGAAADGHLVDAAADPLDGLPCAFGRRAARALVERARRQGRTVVATGGCFDLVHAGHVATLQAARALGDCLVVLVNSDASVRRLKGPPRPLVPEADRVRVLAALGCVDAVVVFDGPTPLEALAHLRPHVFAKGGDYGQTVLPETALLESWGGQTVVLPYLTGRSTTGLVERARSTSARSAGAGDVTDVSPGIVTGGVG